jgi:Zn-dependent protease with chaperone function
MTIPYTLRLICVCLAAFTIIFAVAGLAVSIAAAAAIRLAARMSSAAGARFLFMLRLLPAALAGATVGAVCLPSYVQFEQRGDPEEVGLLCLALTAAAMAILANSFVRAAGAWHRSPNPAINLALVGILRPRVVISESAENVLSREQLAVALRHEQAHARSRDNLKRLLILLAPGPFPCFSMLERAWKRFAEYAADDSAVAGNPGDSLSLAEALVRIARLGEPAGHPLTTSFLASAGDLEGRVNRLLNPEPLRGRSGRVPAGVAMAMGAALLTALLWPATPAQVHNLLEHLMH